MALPPLAGAFLWAAPQVLIASLYRAVLGVHADHHPILYRERIFGVIDLGHDHLIAKKASHY